MHWKQMTFWAVLLWVAVSATTAEAVTARASKAAARVATGTVMAVTPGSRTLVVESTLRDQPWILGIEVPDRAAITGGGKTEKLGDLKAGDRVRVRWVRTEDGLVADSIAVLGTKAP